MPHFADKKDFQTLEDVTTIAEAATRLNVPLKTLLYARDAGNIAAIQRGRIWLVSYTSCLKWLKRPRNNSTV